MFLFVIFIGEIAKLLLIKKQKYFTPIRIIGMFLVFGALALRQFSSSDIQFTIIGGLLILGIAVYVGGWNRKKTLQSNNSTSPEINEK